MSKQKDMLVQMEKDFQITRPIFLNITTGWFDRSKEKSNLVHAAEITVEHIQGRYRLNFTDNKLGIQEFFFDLEWSPFTEDGEEIAVLTKEIVDSYFPRLKKAAKKLLYPILKYIPKQYIYIRASGSGLHIIFFLSGLKNMEQWEKITRFFIQKSKLPNTKNVKSLVFGLDKDTILSSDRKISEFGSWNKLKKELKKEVDYLNYATFLSVDEFYKAEHYPFVSLPDEVNYPAQLKCVTLPQRLLSDTKDCNIEKEPTSPNTVPLKPIPKQETSNTQIDLSNDSIAQKVAKCPAYWSILRKTDTEWYERHFLVKFLKYILNLSMKDILTLFNKYALWSDYEPRITEYYVRKHFREGTCESKVKKPPKKETLVKYGLCIKECSESCIYFNSI